MLIMMVMILKMIIKDNASDDAADDEDYDDNDDNDNTWLYEEGRYHWRTSISTCNLESCWWVSSQMN